MTPNEALAAVKAKIEKTPELAVELTAAYNRVCDAIEARALVRRPKPKVFEVRHETVTARAALFVAAASGKDPAACELDARAAIGL